jgi:GT2 family glycosyltransferase
MLCKIILVNWKRAADTCACLVSLKKTLGIKWYAVICENGSPDNSASELKHFLAGMYIERPRTNTIPEILDYYADDADDMPCVTLVLSQSNLGFAGGCNFAYQHSASVKAEFVWFLNNDTVVEPDTLIRMVERMQQDQSIGLCGSTVIYAHDRRTVQVLGGASYSPWTGFIREIGQGNPWPCKINAHEVEGHIRYVYGASMLATVKFIEQVGPMCEDFFLYYEELDWAERARRAGFRLAYAPQAVVFHKEGAVLGSGKNTRRSMLSEYYGILGRLTITRRYYPLALPTVYLFTLLQILRRCMQGKFARARMMAAVLFGLRHSPPEEQ